MNKERIVDKTTVTRAVVQKIQNDTSPERIRTTHLKGFDDPETIYIKGNEKGYKPDIVAINKNGINVYEIELSDQMPVDKWRLFSTYAQKNNGNLFLVVPDYLKETIKREIQDNEIHSRLIYFDTK